MSGQTFLYFTLLHVLLSCSAENIIIDTDAGADDALAILMLLRAEKLQPEKYKVVAITCTYGNTKVENVEQNVLKTLTMANRTDIPVYRGAQKPLLGKFHGDSYFGDDGFGDAKFNHQILTRIDRSVHASIALVELTKRYEGNVNIVVLGPTTNVALAASLDENFISRVSKFYVMGSSINGWGNYKPNVEFNFGADPESNFILFESTKGSQLTLVPWETAYNTNLSKNWRIGVFGTTTSLYTNFINAIETKSLVNSDDYTPADTMTVAAMLWPRMIKRRIETHVQPVIDGAARGSILVDYSKINKSSPANAEIIQSIDVKLLMEAMIYYLTCEKVDC